MAASWEEAHRTCIRTAALFCITRTVSVNNHRLQTTATREMSSASNARLATHPTPKAPSIILSTGRVVSHRVSKVQRLTPTTIINPLQLLNNLTISPASTLWVSRSQSTAHQAEVDTTLLQQVAITIPHITIINSIRININSNWCPKRRYFSSYSRSSPRTKSNCVNSISNNLIISNNNKCRNKVYECLNNNKKVQNHPRSSPSNRQPSSDRKIDDTTMLQLTNSNFRIETEVWLSLRMVRQLVTIWTIRLLSWVAISLPTLAQGIGLKWLKSRLILSNSSRWCTNRSRMPLRIISLGTHRIKWYHCVWSQWRSSLRIRISRWSSAWYSTIRSFLAVL